jgi:ubiquinol-cytochrome c reductase subunit 7
MSFLTKMWQRAGAAYRANVGKQLASRGLLYEDILVETADVKLALSRLPKDVLSAREQRLKRAMVLSSQQRYLPEAVAAKIDPFATYLSPYLNAVEAENKEQAQLAK